MLRRIAAAHARRCRGASASPIARPGGCSTRRSAYFARAPRAVARPRRASRPLGRRSSTAIARRRRGSTGARMPSRRAAYGADAAGALRIVASHDLALAALREDWHATVSPTCSSRGASTASPAMRRRGRSRGLHVCAIRICPVPASTPLDPARDAAIPFLVRTQGLLLPKVIRRVVRNARRRCEKGASVREPAAGIRHTGHRRRAADTRRDSAVTDRRHGNEEFTHAAVAATVASACRRGSASRPPAARHGLAFVPMLRERYLFVCRRDRWMRRPSAPSG